MMDPKDKRELLQLLEAKDKNLKYRKFYTMYFQDHYIDPVSGCDISRGKYQKAVDLMNATADFREVAVIAPNRSGKSECGAYYVTMHLTKEYPDWYTGNRFKGPITILCIGKTNLAVREVCQKKLLGSKMELGTGMVPHSDQNRGVGITSITSKHQPANAILDAYIKDKDGNLNQVIFLSQEMDAGVIMGMALHVVWFDEECLNRELYDEAVTRTVTTNGIVFHTFTPLDGITSTIMDFMPNRKIPEDHIVRDKDGEPTGRYVTNFSLLDAPHLTQEQVDFQIKKFPAGPIRDARCYGIPSIGAGQIFPIPIEEVLVRPFQIPQHWRVAYGLDFGWEETAAVWVAEDPNTKIKYVFGEYHKGHATPFVHAEALKARGGWIPGAADPAGSQSNVRDGKNLIDEYVLLGLNLTPARNNIEASISRLCIGFESGQYRIFSTCTHLIDEYVLWRYDAQGKPARNQDDHEIDALRYVDSVFDAIAISESEHIRSELFPNEEIGYRSTRNSWSGY